MKHIGEEDLILYYYAETSAAGAIEQHLDACEGCRRRWETLRRVLAAVTVSPVPELAPDYGSAVWHRIRPRLVSKSRFDVRSWVVAAAVAALVAGAFLAGRFWPRPNGAAPVSAESAAEVRERVLLVAVGEHLERSEILLVELSNGGAATPELARDLVASNRLYRHAAVTSGETGLASLLEELEPLLLELAHDPEGLNRELKRRVEARGVLFKVRVVGAGLRERTPPPGARKM